VSANLVVDLHATTQHQPSIAADVTNNWPSSGPIVGQIVDLLHADTACQLQVVAGGGSGVVRVKIETSDSTTSGSFSDPVSGYPAFPQWANIHSGGLWSSGSPLGPPVDGAPLFCSGGTAFAMFQRPGRYARAVLLSGGLAAPVAVNFISQLKTIGSGNGFTYSPTSGVVNV
jgi:hypothetical protein